MKKVFLLVALTIGLNFAFAQKFGYINSEYIIEQMPEYQEAKQELDAFSQKWQEEIDENRKELESLNQEYKAEEVLLTEEMKEERQAEIKKKEKELRELQRKYFGFEGLVFLKRQELVKPIQEKVYKAVEKVARQKRLQFVFDKASDLTMIYTNPIHDYTDYVLEELGHGNPDDTIK